MSKIGSEQWLKEAEHYGKQGLCSYCHKHPIHRRGPGGIGICRVCDDKLDAALSDKRAACN